MKAATLRRAAMSYGLTRTRCQTRRKRARFKDFNKQTNVRRSGLMSSRWLFSSVSYLRCEGF